MSLSTPLAVQVAAPSSQRDRLHVAPHWLGLALPMGLVVAALALRLPYLWTIPRFSDETREVLLSIEVLNGRDPGLVNVDAYIGGFYNWLLAAIFWLTGVSAYTPRLLTAVAGAVAVGFTYLLARDLGGRVAGLIAAGLLATSGSAILSNGHLAWSHCLTPMFTTLAAWLLQRAVRDDSRNALLGAGLAFGLALQTHPATLVLLPGAALYVLWWGRRWLRTPWPYLALLLFLAGFANVLAYNLLTGGNSLAEASDIRDHYSRGRDVLIDVGTYLSNHGAHDLMLLRYLAGAVDTRSGPLSYLLDPTLWIYGALTMAGLIFCARRGAPLLLLMTVSSVVVMPYFNERKYVPIADGRYLMPLLPLAFAGIGALLASVMHRGAPPPAPLPSAEERGNRTAQLPSPLRRRGARGGAPGGAAYRLAWAIGVGLLILYPLVPLGRYYGQEIAAGRTNGPLFQAVDAVVAARRPDEPVLQDRGLRDIKLEAGGTAFRSLRFLLAGVDIDDRSIDNAVDYGRGMSRGSSALLLMDARTFGRFGDDAERLRAIGVESQPVAEPPGSDGYGVYRLERPRAAASSAPAGPRGFSTYSAIDDGSTAQQATPKITSTVPVEPFASGLVNPRGLAFRSDGSLFVALAGTGGPDEVDVGREKPHKYGHTGQIVRIAPDGSKFLMAKNLPSIVTAVNEECGPSAIAFIEDRTYILMASGGWDFGDPSFHSGVYELLSDGSLRKIWDMTEYVLAHPARARREDARADVPAGMAYGMAALGGKLYVTDANQEQLFEVDPASGEARQVVEYPKSNRAMTGVSAGPDGAVYVAEWASNKITRITLDGQIGDGATKLRVPTGVTFGPDGSMYVVEFTGRVLRAAPVGQEQKDILVEGLRAATAITMGPDGNLYVSVFGQGAANGEGEIVRLRLAPPEPGEEMSRWVRGATWAAGLVVMGVMLAIGWRFRQRPTQ